MIEINDATTIIIVGFFTGLGSTFGMELSKYVIHRSIDQSKRIFLSLRQTAATASLVSTCYFSYWAFYWEMTFWQKSLAQAVADSPLVFLGLNVSIIVCGLTLLDWWRQRPRPEPELKVEPAPRKQLQEYEHV